MSVSFIEQITKSNQDEQNFLLRYYARVDVSLKIKILSKHRKIFYSIKQVHSKESSIEEISYVGLILAIKSTYTEFKQLSNKKFDDMDLDDLKNITLLDIQSFKSKKHNKKTKKDKLLQYWGIVKILRSENVSFRDISAYLQKKYKFNIGYSTVYETWRDVEGS